MYTALFISLTAWLLVGCASRPSEPLPSPPAGIRENGVLLVNRSDHNRSAELRVGEQLRVSLPENPGSGYTWAIDETDSRLLMLESAAYQSTNDSSLTARGQRIFSFRVQQSGEMTLQLKLWRFWDGDDSVTERYQVTLKLLP